MALTGGWNMTEELQALAKRIETDHDDLEAWQKLRELVDDPKEKKDCAEQVVRINNERCGIHTIIRCEKCGASMQVLSGDIGSQRMATCPDCQQVRELRNEELPSGKAVKTRTSTASARAVTKKRRVRLTLLTILASNLLPVFGILFLGWSMGSVMILYVIENVIVGFFTVLKMVFVRVDLRSVVGKLMLIPFFCVHFGGFCVGHAAVVIALFGPKPPQSWHWQTLLWELSLPILGMFVSYGIYFVQHYLRNGAYQHATLYNLMFEPYPRLMLLHSGLIVSGFLVVLLGSPIWAVLMIVGLKTGAEVLAYRKSLSKRRSRAGGL
jgi:hypothetical protein